MKTVLAVIVAIIVGIFIGYEVGYEAGSNPASPISQSPSISGMPESAISRPCEKVREFQIFQALPDGGLANACDSVGANLCLGQLAFIPNQGNMEFFDGKRLTAAKSQCFVFDGVYSYTDREKRPRTVPLVWIIDTPKRN